MELIKLKDKKSKTGDKKKSSSRLNELIRDYNFDYNDFTNNGAGLGNIQAPRPGHITPQQAAEQRAQQETVNAMFDYIQYLMDTITPHNSPLIMNRLETLENNLCVDNIAATTTEVEVIAEQIDNIVHQAAQETARVEAARVAENNNANAVYTALTEWTQLANNATWSNTVTITNPINPITVHYNDRNARANAVNPPPDDNMFDSAAWMF